ncbi:hypothetical protein TNCV_3394161 [Trichonephila clavipes]|nr:hypothetical protein TNCV_3394161 [Trichonephila clavipes]
MRGKYSPVPCTRDSAHKTFGYTDLTSTCSGCTQRVFGGIGHRTQGFRSGESDALTTTLPMARNVFVKIVVKHLHKSLKIHTSRRRHKRPQFRQIDDWYVQHDNGTEHQS